MNFMASHNVIPINNPNLPYTGNASPKTFNRNPIYSLTLPSFVFTHKPITSKHTLLSRVYSDSVHPRSSSQNPSKTHFILETIILCIFSLTLLSLRLVSNLLLPDFPHRWNQLIAFSEEAEAKFNHYPSYLRQAVVAYEDRRFFWHFGIDPIGIARAVLSFSALGGGSTITQQLIKNTFLKNERTYLRKIVEMVLALALERTISKSRILSSYLSKIYWGHGVYGIESASSLYFGKHPSLLSLGECALLVGIIPAPELRSPLRDSGRGKIFQARVLKRMVEVGFLDIETALLVAKQSLHLCSSGPDYADVFFLAVSSSSKGLGISAKQTGVSFPNMKEVWDWETESKIWEAREEMEIWVTSILRGKRKEKERKHVAYKLCSKKVL